MTRQDYELIAKVISELDVPYKLWLDLTNKFTFALAGAKNNRTFNPEKFRKRCAEFAR